MRPTVHSRLLLRRRPPLGRHLPSLEELLCRAGGQGRLTLLLPVAIHISMVAFIQGALPRTTPLGRYSRWRNCFEVLVDEIPASKQRMLLNRRRRFLVSKPYQGQHRSADTLIGGTVAQIWWTRSPNTDAVCAYVNNGGYIYTSQPLGNGTYTARPPLCLEELLCMTGGRDLRARTQPVAV